MVDRHTPRSKQFSKGTEPRREDGLKLRCDLSSETFSVGELGERGKEGRNSMVLTLTVLSPLRKASFFFFFFNGAMEVRFQRLWELTRGHS
jgi:hypothetical protein